MPRLPQRALFEEDSSAPVQGLVMSAQAGPSLSPAARSFQQQLARIERLKQQLADMEALRLRFVPLFESALSPLRSAHRQRLRDMALLLDRRLQGTSLTSVQHRTALEILCNLTAGLAAQGDAEMAALHDRYSPRNLAQKAEDEVEGLREMLSDVYGVDLPPDMDASSPEAMRAATMERLRQQADAKRAKREAAAAKRKAKKAPTAAQTQAQAQQQDAEHSLRSLYRQLASALHPDRETDEASRALKNALMSEVNAAYAQRDLVALMHLQVRAQLADAQAVARMDEQKLAGMTRLLKEQVAGLERERAARQMELVHTFELSRPTEVNDRDLQRHLALRAQDLQAQLSVMQADLERVQNNASFKRWLAEQRRQAAGRF